ncbi:MAG TPA: hypothetical protein VJ870_06020, partial [Amycolatopsis sp.]|nr:hypothetical protein [Amycolatopsis sp.]
AATLLAAATPMPATEAQAATSTPTKAVWRLPDGSERTGLVSADGGTPAGAHVPIWLDRAGDPTTPPMTPGDATSLGVGATAAVWAGVVGMLCLLLWLVRLALDGRRDAAWTREWAQLGGDLNRS